MPLAANRSRPEPSIASASSCSPSRMPEAGHARDEIELALSSLNPLLTGNLEQLSDATASEINRWLERTKHVAEQTPASQVAD